MDNLEIEKINLEKQPNQNEKGNFNVEKNKLPENLQEFQKPKSEIRSQQNSQEKISPKSKNTVGSPGIDIKDSPLHQNIEAILESDLEEIYFSMTPQDQEKFKKKGEEITTKIIVLIEEEKFNFKKIFKLILSWLKVIPGVNKFFIEQEAKIKTDRILSLEK